MIYLHETLWEAHAGAGSWQKLRPRRERSPHWNQVYQQDLWPHRRPTLEQPVSEGLKPMGRTHIREVHGGLSPVVETQCWSRGRM